MPREKHTQTNNLYNPITPERRPPNLRQQREEAFAERRQQRVPHLNANAPARRALAFDEVLNNEQQANVQQTVVSASNAQQPSDNRYPFTLFSQPQLFKEIVQYNLQKAYAEIDLPQKDMTLKLFHRLYPLAVEQARLLMSTTCEKEIRNLLALNITHGSAVMDMDGLIDNTAAISTEVEEVAEALSTLEIASAPNLNL